MEYRDTLPSDKPAIAIACTNCSHCQKSKRADWKCGIGDPMKMAERYGWCDKFNLRPRAVTMQIGRYREDVLIPSMKQQLGIGVASGEATEAQK